MSSWFDQLDIGVDLNALQEHIALSLEEAGEIVDSLGRMEIMNLDEMAEKQEAEDREEEEEIIEEVIVHHDDEELPGEVVYHDYHDDRYSTPTVNHLSDDHLNSHLVSVTNEYADAPISKSASQFQRPTLNHSNLKTQNNVTKVVTRKMKKRKKKQKTLDFFGTSAYDGNDENDDNNTNNHNSITNNINHGSSPHLSPINAFDNDVGFALGSLFDVEMPPEEIAKPVISNHHIDGSANQNQKNDDISTYLSTFFSGSDGKPDGSAQTGDVGQGVVSSVLSMTLPSSFSFFDTIDEEINLEEDPILQQVERNRTLGIDATPNKPSYISYLESVLPPPARLFGFESDDAGNSTTEESKRWQQQQQQVDRILGLTGGQMRSSSSAVASSSSLRNCAGYTRNCLIQTRNILIKDLIVTISGHVSVGIKSTRESILPSWIEQCRVLFENLKGVFVPVTNRALHFYHILKSIYMIVITFLKFLWVIVYAILRILISILWHIIQVVFLSSLYVIQCLRLTNNAAAAAPPLSAEERLQQWRTRWRSFAEDYLSSNNALMVMTAILFIYSYYRFQRYSTDAGD